MENITIRQFIDAIEKNGYNQIRGSVVRSTYNGEVEGACAVGQGLLNLGLLTKTGHSTAKYQHYKRSSTGLTLERDIVRMNDEYGMTIPEIVATIRYRYRNNLDEVAFIYNDVSWYKWEGEYTDKLKINFIGFDSAFKPISVT